MHIIIYSHGFGVEKTDRGLFTDIATALPDAQHIMFDYNQIDQATNTLTVAPLTAQQQKLQKVIAKTTRENPHATIDIICHSQGCVVAAMARPTNIRRVIMLAPPAKFVNVEEKIRQKLQRPGAKIDTNNTMHYPRRDGTTTIITAAYWESRAGIEPIDLYNQTAESSTLTIINANQDEVLDSTVFDGLSAKINVINIDGNHDFTNQSRQKLIQIIKEELLRELPAMK